MPQDANVDYTITESHQESQLLPCCITDAVNTVPFSEALEVQGFITPSAHHPCFTLFLRNVMTMDTVQLLVPHDGHDAPTEHRFSSAVLVTLAPLLRRLALHVTQKHLRYLDDELASGQLLFGESSVPEITLIQSVSIQHGVVENPEKQRMPPLQSFALGRIMILQRIAKVSATHILVVVLDALDTWLLIFLRLTRLPPVNRCLLRRVEGGDELDSPDGCQTTARNDASGLLSPNGAIIHSY